MNCISVTIMCYTTRRQCKKDGCLVWVWDSEGDWGPHKGIPIIALCRDTRVKFGQYMIGLTNEWNTDIKYRNNKWRWWLGLETKQAPSVLSKICLLLARTPSITSKWFCWVKCFDSRPMLLAISANNSSQGHSFGTCWQWLLTRPRHSSSEPQFAYSDCWHGASQARSAANQHLHWYEMYELGAVN